MRTVALIERWLGDRVWPFHLIALVAWLGSGFVAWKALPLSNSDFTTFLLPWYEFILTHGRFDAFAHNFYNYSPPYLYLISLGTLLDGWLSPVVIIKLISVAFTALAAIPAYRIARIAGHPPEVALPAALIFCALPSVVLNSTGWGQCDIIYTGFLMFFALGLMQGRPALAAVMLGVAFAFKQQAVFVGPVVLYLVLVGVIGWRHLLLVPLPYLALVLPAALAGRGWLDLLTIYAQQFGFYDVLSFNAPNPYLLIDAFLPGHYQLFVALGLLLTVGVSLWLAAAFLRRHPRGPAPDQLLLMLTLSLTLEPYILPKMHERYFFPATIFAFLLLLHRPRTWPVLLLLEVSNLLTYALFLRGRSPFLLLSVVLVTVALALLLRWCLRRDAPGRSARPALRPAE